MARHLYRLMNLTFSPARTDLKAPDAAYVWVIGDDDWLRTPSAHTELFRRMHEGEGRDDYRITITGAEWTEGPPGYIDWPSWYYQAGMAHRKRHRDKGGFLTCGELLLDMMLDTADGEHAPSSRVLDRFGVPYTFYGRGPNRRDDLSAGRIQQ